VGGGRTLGRLVLDVAGQHVRPDDAHLVLESIFEESVSAAIYKHIGIRVYDEFVNTFYIILVPD
jgi:hypothetical protein